MNKRKLSIGLVSSLIAVLALSACNEVTSNDKAIVTYKDSKGQEVAVLTNDIYNKYRTTSDGISKFYTAILESIIRHTFDTATGTVYKKSKEKILAEAKDDVTGAQQEAEENRKTNGTSYDEEWQKILDSHNCKDANELLEYYKYQIEKEEIEDKYFADHKADLMKEYLGVDKEGKTVATLAASAALPHHVRHVLVKVGEGATSFADGTVSESEAKGLATAIKYLTDKNFNFSEVAKKISEDTGSAEKGGDLGIMTTTTSFVNEFKLGIYAFEAIKSHKENLTSGDIEAQLGLNSKYRDDKTAMNFFDELGIQQVPFGAFKAIGEVAEDTADDKGHEVNGGNSHYYPRNILWNKYLNLHSPFVITNEEFEKDAEGNFKVLLDGEGVSYLETKVNETLTDRFVEFPQMEGKKVLCDEKGNVIIGVRSEHGIHFMILQKSIYDFSEAGGVDNVKPSLEEYYTTYTPGTYDATDYSKSYPYYKDGDSQVEKDTYVNYLYSEDKSVYDTRASEIKSAIKSFDSTYDYRLYEQYSKDLKFNATDGYDLGAKITEYINATRYTNKNSNKESLQNSWRTYIELIELQNATRTEAKLTKVTDDWYKVEDNNYRMIPVRCIIGFKDSSKVNAPEWTVEGGACYYVK